MIVDQLGREAIVAGVDRRVRREHRALRDVLRAGPEVGAASASMRRRAYSSVANALWPSFRCSTPQWMPARAQRADAAHAQQQLLADADALVAEVEARRELAVLVGVAVDVGVEQQEPVAPDRDLPDLRAAASRATAAPR